MSAADPISLDCQDVPKHVNEKLIHPNGYLISWGWLREALDRFWLLIKFSVLWPLNLWWSEKINISTKNAASEDTMNSAENRYDAFWWPMMKLSQCHRIILRWAICHFPWEVGCFGSSSLEAGKGQITPLLGRFQLKEWHCIKLLTISTKS